jgi:hypothetical protein
MTGKAAPVRRRPHRSNSPLAIVRGIKTLKTIYWTTSRLRRLLPGVFSTERERHFARAVEALKSLPKLTLEENIEACSRINPGRLMHGRWAWPKSVSTLMREYADRAPLEGVDTGKLRKALKGMDRRTRERFMELVVEDLPTTREREFDWRLFGKIARAHNWLMDAIRRDPDPNVREIDISAKPVIPGRWEIRQGD